MQIVARTAIAGYPLLSRGKVRDIYEISPDTLLLVTTDRMSAFDVVMGEPVPYKGVILNQITLYWMKRFSGLIANHLLEEEAASFPKGLRAHQDLLEGRSVLVRKARPLPVECIVRGFLAGSGWKDYQATGRVCGLALPQGLALSQRLERPLFTPSTKAELGEHDRNITAEEGMLLAGASVYRAMERASLEIYRQAAEEALGKGIVIADTKLEFGLCGGELLLIDEVLTPDSSRFWPSEGYAPGRAQPSFDKQFLRDWLESRPWDKTFPPPALPPEVIAETGRKYREAYTRLTGRELPLPC
ncbi:MAG: phosphoribosylaminoimidazolesuccinocarboxamide synthase [Deltaproteobacteria bacterium]|jgi:phosphoribosylaminoimidazole-succinocarboxamide synthase|nr:phosphoribosylaminoimidazolesuccinocarboxamide synthase [Deltaproteobacteria bacterium]